MSGLNLDPMFFWPQVMRWHEKVCPMVVFQGFTPPKLSEWSDKYKNVDFIVEDGDEIINKPNVSFRWRERMDYKSWVESWARTDYLVCDKNNKDYWLQASLCGTRALHTLEDFERMLPTLIPLAKIDRIDNWEKAKNLLT